MTRPFGQDSIWTDRTRTLVRKHHAEGLSCGESAKLLGDAFTRNAVAGCRHRMGLCKRIVVPKPKPPPKPAPVRMLPAPKPRIAPPRPLPMDGSPPETARPWITRTRRECCWPVGGRGADTLYCCARITEPNTQGWCENHAAIGYSARAGTLAGFRPGLRRA